MSKYLTPKERNLLKGAMRRVFARSDLRKSIIEASVIEHSDPKRKRVKTWCRCAICKQPTPKSYMQVDHILPLIGLHEQFSELSLDEVAERMWCDPTNLQACCEACHDAKSKAENKIRREIKRNSKIKEKK